MTAFKVTSAKELDSKTLSSQPVITTSYADFEQLALGQQTSARFNAVSSTRTRWYNKLLALPAYYWVLIAQIVVILPHATHLPLWLMGFAVVSIAAQLPRIKAKFSQARHLKRLYQGVQMLGFLLGLAGLWLTYNAAFGLDMGVAFLVLCLISKLWELYKRRDAYVVLNLSLFVLAALFLMDQGLVTTLEVVVGTIAILLAFIALNDDGNTRGDGRLRTLGVLGISALPLLVVLFLFFPRLPPLWSVQLSDSTPLQASLTVCRRVTLPTWGNRLRWLFAWHLKASVLRKASCTGAAWCSATLMVSRGVPIAINNSNGNPRSKYLSGSNAR